MKTTLALFIALVTLLPHSANATTLTITGGTIVTSPSVATQNRPFVARQNRPFNPVETDQ